jgi:hypothetical protein
MGSPRAALINLALSSLLVPGALTPNLTGVFAAIQVSMLVTPLAFVSAQTTLSFTGTPIHSTFSHRIRFLDRRKVAGK